MGYLQEYPHIHFSKENRNYNLNAQPGFHTCRLKLPDPISSEKLYILSHSQGRSGIQVFSLQSSYEYFEFHIFVKGIIIKDTRYVSCLPESVTQILFSRPFFSFILSQSLLPATRVPHIMAKFAFKEQIPGEHRAIPANPEP